MTTAPASARPTRPGSTTVGTALVVVAALTILAQPVWFLGSYLGMGTLPMISVVAQTVVPTAAYVVCVPGLLRGRQWARVAVTAMATVQVLGALPNLLLAFGDGPDPLLLAYTAAEIALVVALALLWTPDSRTWFGPVR